MLFFCENSQIFCTCDVAGCGNQLNLTGKIAWHFEQDIESSQLQSLNVDIEKNGFTAKQFVGITYHYCTECKSRQHLILRKL